MRALLACMVTAILYKITQAQPVECDTDGVNQCESGYYCVPQKYVCRKCIDCEELKRDTLLGAPLCIQSVANCGSCFKGLVPDLGNSIECVLPNSSSDDGIPAYVWAAVGGLILFVLVGLIVVYVLRNTYTFKILASTRTSVQSPCNRNGHAATAPESPPPYNALYTPVRPSSPPPDVAPSNESPWGYVKRAASTRIGAEGRESAGSQAARVYSNPSYVRGAHLADLPSYDAAGEAEREAEREAAPHDEDTMESSWTPDADGDLNVAPASGGGGGAGGGGGGGGAGGGAGELSSLLAAARTATLLRPPAASPQYCATQDTNNNRSTGEGLGSGEGGPSSSGPSFIINVVQNINAVQQQNDVSV